MIPPVLAFSLGSNEIMLGLLIVVLLFGAAKIPELARSMGRAKAEYQKASREGEREVAASGSAAGASEDEKTLRAARELGIPTEGRAISDVKADIKRKLGA